MKPIKLNSHIIGKGYYNSPFVPRQCKRDSSVSDVSSINSSKHGADIFCMIFILKEKDKKAGRGAVQMHPLNGVTGGVTLLAGA